MSLFDKITSKNFVAYAMKHYDDPQCEDIDEFHDDLKRFRYLKRLLHRYHEEGELRERLILNHIITLFNVFGFDPCMRMLKFKITEKEHWKTIKTMLLYLDYVTDTWETDIPVDIELAKRLRVL